MSSYDGSCLAACGPILCPEIAKNAWRHYSDAIINTATSQTTGVSIVCTIVCSGADQRKHQSYGSLRFVRGIHRWPVNSPHKGPVPRKMFYLMTSSWRKEEHLSCSISIIQYHIPNVLRTACFILFCNQYYHICEYAYVCLCVIQ